MMLGRSRICTYSKAPGRVDEAGNIDVEATRDRVHNSELAKSEDDVEHHDTDDKVVNDQTSRAARSEGVTSTNEETSTDGAADSNHVQVATLHGLVQLVVAVEIRLFTPLEGLGGDTHTTPETEAVVVLIVVEVIDGAGVDMVVVVAGGDIAAAGGLLTNVGSFFVGHGVFGLGSHVAHCLEREGKRGNGQGLLGEWIDTE